MYLSEIYRLDISYIVISRNFISTAFTTHDLEKISASFDLKVGELLLLEAPNLNDGILVGSQRALYFATDTRKIIDTFNT